MKCPICGRDNPDIRLFCSRCGELLPESEADDDIRVYKRGDVKKLSDPAGNVDESKMERGQSITKDKCVGVSSDTYIPNSRYSRLSVDAANEQETVSSAHTPDKREDDKNAVPADKEVNPDAYALDDDMDFFRRRKRMRRVYEEAWPEKPAPHAKESLFDDTAETPQRDSDSPFSRPDNLDERKPPVLNRRDIADTGRVSTLIPKRDELSMDDLFAVRGQLPAPEPPSRPKTRRNAAGEFEDTDKQSFAMKHMRGIVAIILLVFSAAIVLIWAFTPDAQETLARLDMAWSAKAYEKLGLEAYNAGDYASAGHLFAEALKRDDVNEGYAVYAANSYIEGGYTAKAVDSVKNCISISPENADYYVTLMDICGGYDAMTDSDKALISEGYRLTGDSRLDK